MVAPGDEPWQQGPFAVVMADGVVHGCGLGTFAALEADMPEHA